MCDDYLKKRKAIECFFIPENKIADSCNTLISPNGNYELEIFCYSTGPNSWDYSRGIVRRLSDKKVVVDVKRNYSHFWHAWVSHPNKNEYFLCGEDYQGYSVINLTTGANAVFFPENGYRGFGFCWAAVYPSPDGLILAVDGCYWACPYEIAFFDFSNPEKLPFPEIDRYEGINDPITGWVNNETFVFSVTYEARKSDKKKYNDLTDEEQDLVDKDSSQLIEVKENFEWKRLKKKKFV